MAFSEIFKKAGGWVKSHPAYSIGGAGGAVFIGYLLYKQEQAKAQQSTASGASGTQPSQATSQFAAGDFNATPSYDYLYGFYTGDQQAGSSGGSSSGGSSGGTPPPTPQPPPVPGPTAVWVTVGKEVPSGSSLQSLGATQADNPWAAGYNWNLPLPDGTEVKLEKLGMAGARGIGSGVISGWNRIMSHHDIWNSPDTWVSLN